MCAAWSFDGPILFVADALPPWHVSHVAVPLHVTFTYGAGNDPAVVVPFEWQYVLEHVPVSPPENVAVDWFAVAHVPNFTSFLFPSACFTFPCPAPVANATSLVTV